jgi:hypothetical protein
MCKSIIKVYFVTKDKGKYSLEKDLAISINQISIKCMIGKETQKLKENSRSHSLEKYPTQMGFI